MNASTLSKLRTAYYIGVGVLVLYVMPASGDVLSKYLQYEVTPGISLIAIIATFVGLGAFMAYNRKYI
jgi:uncharacterized membrane protein